MPDYSPVLDALKANPLVPVLTLHSAADARSLARKLDGIGLRAVEATLRTDCALEAMRAMKDEVPELLVGMGTILFSDDMSRSIDAGADFIVTPATTPKLIEALKASPVPVFPAVATPSEALSLFEHGFEFQKFFPAEVNGGVRALKAWQAPLPQIKFMPTGGINEDTYQEYLGLPNVIAVGGSWMVK